MSGQPAKITIDERFRQVAADVQKGRLPISVAAQAFNVNERTIRNTIDRMKATDMQVATYAKFDTFEKLPGMKDFEAWLVSRMKTPSGKTKAARGIFLAVKTCWEDCFDRKNLTLLTDQDMVKFVNWADALPGSQDKRRSYFQAMRYLLRFGIPSGKFEWLSKYLTIKGRKGDPRMPPELKTKEVFVTVMPRLYDALSQMEKNNEKVPKSNLYVADVCDTQHLVLRLKSVLQARTGLRAEQREVWGTVINNPSNTGSSLLLSQEGKVLHWTVKCKGRETWEIPREAFETDPQLCDQVETYIRKHQLKTGDFLICNLEAKDSRKILKRQAELAGLSHFILHDMRKVSATTCALAGMTLEQIANFGVGWKDTATLMKHYISIKGLNMPEAYAKLRAYKQGTL